MKVSNSQPFQIVYSLFVHEYLGFLFESFIILLDKQGKFTFQNQNISSKNAPEFAAGLDATDYELIALMDDMHQEKVIKRFAPKKLTPPEFFNTIYHPEKGSPEIQKDIDDYLEEKRASILKRLSGKEVYEMGRDGEPAWRKIHVHENRATVLFHLRKNENNTHYFPTIKHDGAKLDFQYQNAIILCKKPAWLLMKNQLYGFKGFVDGNKLIPFLNKRFIVIPQKLEETYFRKFVAPLLETFDVFSKGFNIKEATPVAEPVLTFAEIEEEIPRSNGNGNGKNGDIGYIDFRLSFNYGNFSFRSAEKPVSVEVEKIGDEFIFHKILRNTREEVRITEMLRNLGLFNNGTANLLPRNEAFDWIYRNREHLEESGVKISQEHSNGRAYFVGRTKFDLDIREGIDWFDINARILFGPFEIPFKEIRKLILKKKREFILPNGEIAIIPDHWFAEYSEFLAFVEEDEQTSKPGLDKHHLGLVRDLESGNLAKVAIGDKLEKLRNFDSIDVTEIPGNFKGELRPYQKAGYDWLNFLNTYKFGGCLADDMGLGKTVQTLALLQREREQGVKNASILIMPTSLIYNWLMEAKKFTPKLKIHAYAGSDRQKDVSLFSKYDLIITSYGITRLDVDILNEYYFNYVILDESQAIKNPQSNISKSVRKLRSRNKLILTGTPLENSTLDLWSQMNFINPGLLGSESYFKKEFLKPIEKKQDADKTRKLNNIIKPFILRRNKSQVARELPAKIENIRYCSMSNSQQEKYEEVKSYYRNQILDHIDRFGVRKSQMLLIQGLTKLRQIANHPRMIDTEYDSDSGKYEDVIYMTLNAISEDHKILIFSQFVKHLTIFREYMDRNGISYAYLDGSTKDRKGQVELFQNNKDVRIFFISLKAGGLGLNLTEADYVFILDPWWNPAVENQAIDRAHRIGQTNRVFTYKFISRKTVEEKILALQQRKLKMANDLISSEEGFIKNLSRQDIEQLLN